MGEYETLLHLFLHLTMIWFQIFIGRYDIMMQCWSEEPEDRPTFSQLRERLETIMQKEVLYTDLDTAFQSSDESGESVHPSDEENGANEENNTQIMTTAV